MTSNGDPRTHPDPVPRPLSGLTIPPKGSDRGPQAAKSATLTALRQRLAAGDATAVARFWHDVEARGAPLIEPSPDQAGEYVVTFLARERDPTVEVLLFANRVTDPEYYHRSVLTPLDGTDVRYLSLRVGGSWRCQYRLGRAPGELTPQALSLVERSLTAGSPVPRELLLRWWGAQAVAKADPLHHRDGRWAAAVTDGSWVEMPDAPAAPRLVHRPDAAERLARHDFHSRTLGGSRHVWVYTPPPTCAAERDPGVLVLTDGEDWARNGLISALLDGPIAAGVLPPLIVVLIEAGSVARRVEDLACSTVFVDTLCGELLPQFVDPLRRFGPDRTIIAGASLGGLTAAYAGLRRPDRFGLVYSQSGSFWWPTVTDQREEPAWLTRCFAAAPLRPLRFRIEAGLHEHVLLGATRHFRDVLRAKGYELSYQEVDGGHDFLWWAAHLPIGLEELTRDW